MAFTNRDARIERAEAQLTDTDRVAVEQFLAADPDARPAMVAALSVNARLYVSIYLDGTR